MILQYIISWFKLSKIMWSYHISVRIQPSSAPGLQEFLPTPVVETPGEILVFFLLEKWPCSVARCRSPTWVDTRNGND